MGHKLIFWLVMMIAVVIVALLVNEVDDGRA